MRLSLKLLTHVKKIKMEWAKGLVNAILRRYIREADRLNLLDSDDSLKTSHPQVVA